MIFSYFANNNYYIEIHDYKIMLKKQRTVITQNPIYKKYFFQLTCKKCNHI